MLRSSGREETFARQLPAVTCAVRDLRIIQSARVLEFGVPA
jgi:hypothetical protein